MYRTLMKPLGRREPLTVPLACRSSAGNSDAHVAVWEPKSFAAATIATWLQFQLFQVWVCLGSSACLACFAKVKGPVLRNQHGSLKTCQEKFLCSALPPDAVQSATGEGGKQSPENSFNLRCSMSH